MDKTNAHNLTVSGINKFTILKIFLCKLKFISKFAVFKTIIKSKEMEAISIEPKRIVHSFSAQTDVTIEKERYSNLANFLKGTISGDELVKYVCDRLDEKYSKSQLCGL